MKIVLYRTPSTEFGVFGYLFVNQHPLCLTLEDPWKENKIGESCIPAGKYKCTPHNGTKYKNVWKVNNVPGRSNILIHWGNLHTDTRGCILVGDSTGAINGVPAVLNSQKTIKLLRDTLPKTFDLEIRNYTPQVFTNPPKLSWFESLFKKGD